MKNIEGFIKLKTGKRLHGFLLNITEQKKEEYQFIPSYEKNGIRN